jgi:hypothetical protein
LKKKEGKKMNNDQSIAAIELPPGGVDMNLSGFELHDLASALLERISEIPENDGDDFDTLHQLWELSRRLSSHPSIISFDQDYEDMCAEDEVTG